MKKIGHFQEEVAGPKERETKVEYGEYILYPNMKTEE
jgi:hypothetical protein